MVFFNQQIPTITLQAWYCMITQYDQSIIVFHNNDLLLLYFIRLLIFPYYKHTFTHPEAHAIHEFTLRNMCTFKYETNVIQIKWRLAQYTVRTFYNCHEPCLFKICSQHTTTYICVIEEPAEILYNLGSSPALQKRFMLRFFHRTFCRFSHFVLESIPRRF